jgi:hypothetical protein
MKWVLTTLLYLVIVALLALAVMGCGEPQEFSACSNHGGVQEIGDDATNSNVLVACKDGTVVRVKM